MAFMDNINILQCNLNRSWDAFNLLKQSMTEFNVGISAIAEPPHGVTGLHTWFVSNNGQSAILWCPERTSFTGRLLNRSRNCVLVNFGNLNVMACYISPNLPITRFEDFIDEMDSMLCLINFRSVLICGDFNCKSTFWGCDYTNGRGRLLTRWSDACNLSLVNISNDFTCIRPQGRSIVDLTWISSDLQDNVTEWKVMRFVETLSDHLYIFMRYSKSNPSVRRESPIAMRWNIKKMNVSLFYQLSGVYKPACHRD